MKRLLAQSGIAYFSVLAVAFYLSEKAVAVLLAAAVIAFLLLLCFGRTRRMIWAPAVAFTVALACCVNLCFTYLEVIPKQERFSGGERRIEATLTDEVYRAYSKYYYRLTTDRIDGEEVGVKLLLKTAKPIAIEPFDTVAFTAEVSATDNRYYLSKGYYLTVNTFEQDFTVREGRSRPLYYYAICLRQTLRRALDAYLPGDVADLCKAVFVGDKYALDADTKDSFRYAGASYFVVVSGLHFSIICLLLYRLLDKLRLHRAVTVGIVFCLLLLYMGVTGFQPSVVRSGVMMTVLMGGRLLRRISYPHNSLGLAAIVSSLVFGPYGAGDIGLILSFAATFAIITWCDPIHRRLSFKDPDTRLKRAVNAVTAVLSMSLAAGILVFPISVYVFRGFSLVTVVSSLVLYLPIQLLLILSLGVCLFYPLGVLRWFSMLLSWILYAAGRFVLWVVEGLSSLPFSYIGIGHDFFYIWVGVTILLGCAVIACRRRFRFFPYAVILSAVLLIGGMTTSAIIRENTIELTVYQCGDGLTVGYRHRGTLYLLAFDAKSYTAYHLLDELAHNYGGAQLAVCSRKSDLINYSRVSDREFPIAHYLAYDAGENTVDPSQLIAYRDGDAYLPGDGATLKVAHSGDKLLSYLNVCGTTVMILPRNYPFSEIPEEYRRADIIVLCGMRDGYEALACDTLIVSCADGAEETARQMVGRFRNRYDTCDGDVTVDLR